ncbi:MAG TPA: glucoamylase family protein [Kofleriaceae bacterium]
MTSDRALAITAAVALGCGAAPGTPAGPALSAADSAMIDELEHRTFDWFWTTADPVTGLVPDRAPTPSFSSIAAVGFGLTAYAIGAERGWVSRADARDRVIKTLTFFRDAPQGDAATGMTGYKGFYYHFLDMHTGQRYRDVELSSVDTALLLAGVMFCREYFAGGDEAPLRQLADTLLERVDWTWMQPRAPAIAMGWQPEHGFIAYDWLGYNEGMIVQLLALGSPSHPVVPATWDAWQKNYDKTWGPAYGQTLLGFPPLFGHQYSHLWVDFRGIRDRYMATRGLDYFENSRRATLAQRAYAIANPDGWTGYSAEVWGLTASDGPGDMTRVINGKDRTIRGYAARGMASYDDGTIAPAAMIGSIAFAPELVVPGIRALKQRYGDKIYRPLGFADAFNPTLDWVDPDALGIDQGPIIGMIENFRSELVWATMRKSGYLQRALRRAGFTGGWLEAGS